MTSSTFFRETNSTSDIFHPEYQEAKKKKKKASKHLPGVSRQEDLLAPRRQQAHYSNQVPLRPALTFAWRHNRPLLSPSTAGALKFPQRRCRKISLGQACQCQLGGQLATCEHRHLWQRLNVARHQKTILSPFLSLFPQISSKQD